MGISNESRREDTRWFTVNVDGAAFVHCTGYRAAQDEAMALRRRFPLAAVTVERAS